MQNYKKFTAGKARTAEQLELQNRDNVKFLFAEDGSEWYGCQKTFAADTIKFSYDEDGVICSVATNKDVSSLWPDGLSVAEVVDTTANRRADILGGWVFDGENIVPRVYTAEERQKMAEQKKQALMAEAEGILAPLERAVKLGMATDEEKARLEAWERYSVMLSRVGPQDAPNIAWPDRPAATLAGS